MKGVRTSRLNFNSLQFHLVSFGEYRMSGEAEKISESKIRLQEPNAVDSTPLECEFLDRHTATRRYPIVPILLALIAGILADRFASISWTCWIVVGLVSLSCWSIFYLRSLTKIAICSLLLTCVTVGGIRHTFFWHIVPENSIERFLEDERQLVSLKAIVLTSPEKYEVHRSWSRVSVVHTRCVLRCEELDFSENTSRVSGKIRLTVKDEVTNLAIGDVVKIVGWISNPSEQQNPGEFDYREHLKRSGIVAVLSIEKSEEIERIETSAEWFLQLRRAMGYFRKKCSKQIDAYFDADSAAIAKAVLLGNRSQLDDRFLKKFAETGLIHILAISGLHVGIFLAPFWLLFHMLKLSPRSTFLFTMIVILFFILLTGARPSVLRASLVVTVFLGGTILHRKASLLNAISFSAVVILLHNPASLFDIGTQLSFLSIYGILVAGRWGNLFEESRPVSKIDEIIEEHRSYWFRSAKKYGKNLLQGILISAGIWLTILPLLVYTFHLVSVAGLIVNVFFVPLVGIFLWCGYAFLLSGFFLPFLATVFSWFFLIGIGLLKSFVIQVNSWEFGHFYFAGPPVWWMIFHYVLLLLSCVVPYKALHKTLFVFLLLGWLGFGAVLGFREHKPGYLECTFLSVGHGVAILVELPDGKVVLYDAGSLTSSKYASRVVTNALWSKGHSKIDAVFLSHADADHFNALPEILSRFSVGKVYLTTQFIDHTQLNTVELYESLENLSIPVQFVASGKEISFGDVRLKILHPQSKLRYENDNANSMVISVEYQGRRILLTGDLEEEGMEEFLKRPYLDVDAMLAPHHGSQKSNPVELAKWATPEVVVISGSRKSNIETIRSRYNENAEIYLTAESGAVAVRVYPDGRIATNPFRLR